jgi:hypothetical protein
VIDHGTALDKWDEPSTAGAVIRAVDVPLRDPTGGRLVAWASGLSAAHQIGTALCQTSFAPKHFQGKPEEAAAAIMFGDEIGLTPAQALRSIYVVSGTPALYARVMVALVLSHGHDIWTDEDTPSRVTVCGRRAGRTVIETVTWTTDRARKAGYTSNRKYESDPQAMLYARASGDVARRVAPDVLAGLAFTVEEMELQNGALARDPGRHQKRHSDPDVTRDVTSGDALVTRKVRRKPVTVEPSLDEPKPSQETPESDTQSDPQTDVGAGSPDHAEPPSAPSEEPAPTSPPQPLSAAQKRMLHASFNEHDISERADRLAFASSVIGRDIASSNELTKGEASDVIDALARYGQPDPEEPPDDET